MDPLQHVAVVVLGGIFFPTVYSIVYRLVSLKEELSVESRCEISLRIASAVQAFLSCSAGVIIITSVTDIMRDRHWLTNAYACFGAPYFYYDTWAMYQTYKYRTADLNRLPLKTRIMDFVTSRPLMMCHHLLLPVIYLPVIVYWRNGLGDFFVGCFYLFELAVPFISLRTILLELRLDHTLLYAVNGVLLISSFALCRVLIFPYLYRSYAQYKNLQSVFSVPLLIPIKCNVGCLSLVILQLYWLYKMVVVAFKTIRKRRGYNGSDDFNKEEYFDISLKKINCD